MGPKRRNSETDEQIIKQGCLTKSPPSYIFNNKTSWKGRLLKLCRTSLGAFILRYYAYDGVSEEWKGDIHMSDITSIEVGSHTMERIPTIIRLFSNSPNNILCIKTERRDYYLVGDSTESIAEWEKYITDAWVKVRHKMTEELLRPKSYPADHPCTETAHERGMNRQRSHTDPVREKRDLLTLNDIRESTYEVRIEDKDVFSEEQDGDLSEVYSYPTFEETQQSQDVRRHSPAASLQEAICEEQDTVYNSPSFDKTQQPEDVRRHLAAASLQADAESRDDDETDPAYDSEQESVYDRPRSIPVKMIEVAAGDQEQTSDLESEEDSVYEKMASIVIDEVTDLPSEPLQNLPVTPKHRSSKTQRSQLKKAQILRMMYEPHSESDLVPIKLTVEIEHLQKYLGLQEIGERLCVSKWKGPLHIGCLFHHGDQIDSINGFRPGSKAMFLQMLSNCITNEVNLVLTRNNKAAVFHLEGCSCGGS